MQEAATGRLANSDMSTAEFRHAMELVTDRIAAFLEDPKKWRVFPDVSPGDVRAALPAKAPEQPDSFDDIMADFDRLIMPATTHWNHPGFMAYFANTGSAPGILAEALIAALNVNAMVWRSGPAQTELEEVTLAWLRDLMGLPADFDGVINDTASSSTLYALAAARELHPALRIREDGLAGRSDVPRLSIYCSQEAHSAADKAAITLGIGLKGIRRIPTNAAFEMDVEQLRAAVAADKANGILPLAVVATVGTTSTAAIDSVPLIADVCAEEGMWLHVDAAYGGAAALLPEMRYIMAGCERAHSLVVNPHKWLFVPMDCSVLFTRRPDLMRRAFSIVPDYLLTPEDAVAKNLMDYGISLGRRFRALKLWFVFRCYGVEKIRAAIREHCRLAAELGEWVTAQADFELLAPQRFSVVVFRYRPDGRAASELDGLNERILERLNASGDVFLSQTKARGVFALRVALGNLRTGQTEVGRLKELLREAVEAV